ncbi:MAG TPA: hypothetical protein VHC22_09630 [Pirellulales bacterium]|nr:hypothetical protein [Pirellulales bacterium]
MVESADSHDPAREAASDFAIVTDRPDDDFAIRRPLETSAPKLGVGHLLLWTGCCALYLGLARLLIEGPAGSAGAIFLACLAAGQGAAWTGLVITLARSLRGSTWPVEPGQWLLAVMGVMVTVELLAEFVGPGALRNRQGVVLAVTACAFVVPLFCRRLAPRWKLLFGALAFLYAFPMLVAILAGQVDLPDFLNRTAAQFTPQHLATATALATVALAPLERKHTPRGWLHWTGIGTAVWLALLPLVATWVL